MIVFKQVLELAGPERVLASCRKAEIARRPDFSAARRPARPPRSARDRRAASAFDVRFAGPRFLHLQLFSPLSLGYQLVAPDSQVDPDCRRHVGCRARSRRGRDPRAAPQRRRRSPRMRFDLHFIACDLQGTARDGAVRFDHDRLLRQRGVSVTGSVSSDKRLESMGDALGSFPATYVFLVTSSDEESYSRVRPGAEGTCPSRGSCQARRPPDQVLGRTDSLASAVPLPCPLHRPRDSTPPVHLGAPLRPSERDRELGRVQERLWHLGGGTRGELPPRPLGLAAVARQPRDRLEVGVEHYDASRTRAVGD
jgi:hypothetical protein